MQILLQFMRDSPWWSVLFSLVAMTAGPAIASPQVVQTSQIDADSTAFENGVWLGQTLMGQGGGLPPGIRYQQRKIPAACFATTVGTTLMLVGLAWGGATLGVVFGWL
jgi:hypothetical protein